MIFLFRTDDHSSLYFVDAYTKDAHMHAEHKITGRVLDITNFGVSRTHQFSCLRTPFTVSHFPTLQNNFRIRCVVNLCVVEFVNFQLHMCSFTNATQHKLKLIVE